MADILPNSVPEPRLGDEREPWFIVPCAIIGSALGAASITHFGLPGLFKDMARELHFTRGGAASALSFFLIGIGFGLSIAGMLIDRIGPKWTALMAIVSLSIGLAAIGLAQSQVMVLAVSFVMGLLSGASTPLPYLVVISARFDRRRGLATGLGTTGLGFGGIFLPPMIGYLATHYSWRGALLSLAGLVIIVAGSCALLALDMPRNHASAAPTVLPEPTTDPVPLRSMPFWLITVAVCLANFFVSGVVVQGISLLTDHGFDRAGAAIVISSLSIASIFGRLTCGVLMDWFVPPRVAAIFLSMASVGMLFLLLASHAWMYRIGFVLIGITLGAEADVISYLTSRYFPQARHGQAMGLMLAIFNFANAAGIALTGYCFDYFGSYVPAIVLAVIAGPCSALIILCLDKYKQQAPANGVA